MRDKADEFAQKVLPIIEKLKAAHYAATGKRLTLAGIASALDDMGVQPARGGRWHAATVKRLLERAQVAKRVRAQTAELKTRRPHSPLLRAPRPHPSRRIIQTGGYGDGTSWPVPKTPLHTARWQPLGGGARSLGSGGRNA